MTAMFRRPYECNMPIGWGIELVVFASVDYWDAAIGDSLLLISEVVLLLSQQVANQAELLAEALVPADEMVVCEDWAVEQRRASFQAVADRRWGVLQCSH